MKKQMKYYTFERTKTETACIKAKSMEEAWEIIETDSDTEWEPDYTYQYNTKLMAIDGEPISDQKDP
jgi:hypothetical protein